MPVFFYIKFVILIKGVEQQQQKKSFPENTNPQTFQGSILFNSLALGVNMYHMNKAALYDFVTALVFCHDLETL